MVSISAYQAGLGQQRHTPDPTPQQNLHVNADMFGGGQARTMRHAAQGLDQGGEEGFKIRQENDERGLLEAEQRFREWKTEVLYGKNGVYKRKGKSAFGVTKDVDTAFDQMKGEAESSKEFYSPEAKRRLSTYFDQQRNSLKQSLLQYEEEQKTAYDSGLTEARITGAKEDAATNYLDPAAIGTAKSTIVTSLQKQAKTFGWSPEETNQQIEKEVSAMHMAVMDRMLANGQGQAAKEYLSIHKKEIDGSDIAKAEKSVEAGSIRQQAQSYTDGIIARGLSSEESLAEARKIKDPTLRDEVVQRVKIRMAEQSAADATRIKELKLSAWAKISQGMTPDQLTPQELAAAGREVESMWTMTRNQAQRGKPFAVTTKAGLKAKLGGMSDSEIVDVDLTAHMGSMTEADWNSAKARQEKAKRNIEKLQQDPGSTEAIERVLRQNAPKKLNWGTQKASDDDRALANKARDAMHDFVAGIVEKTNRKPTETEMRTEAARILTEINFDSEKTFTFDLSGSVLELQDEDISDYATDTEDIAKATGVPADKLPALIQAILNSKHKLTVNNIRRVWEANK